MTSLQSQTDTSPQPQKDTASRPDISPQPQPIQFQRIISSIEEGQVKVPQFQRDFVWDLNKTAKFIDSILRGYPVGTFIYWRTTERLRMVKNIGNIPLPDPRDGEYVNFVLDGQQRITSLYACVRGAKIKKDDREFDYGELFLDLTADEDDPLVIYDTSGKDLKTLIKVSDLVYGRIKDFMPFGPDLVDKVDYYRQKILTYNFSVVEVRDAPLDVATEIFTRINVTGEPLSTFEIMVAKTFDADRDFDLSEKYAELQEDLERVEFGTIADSTILQLVSSIIVKDCTRKSILKLDKQDFIDTWPEACKAVRQTVDYFRIHFGIPASQLLPYSALTVPIAYYFHKSPQNPVGQRQRLLDDFFWRVALTHRYSSGLEGRLGQDLTRIDEILKDKQPTYEEALDISPKFIIDNGWFSTGRSFIKAILSVLASQKPKRFDNGDEVTITNAWLKQANSKNYHHFFPQSWLKKHPTTTEANNIVNVTIVDDFLNKRRIRTRAPSDYMSEFKKENSNFETTMLHHLISVEDDGIWQDDYETFANNRAKRISEALEKRVILQKTDSGDGSIALSDLEDVS